MRKPRKRLCPRPALSTRVFSLLISVAPSSAAPWILQIEQRRNADRSGGTIAESSSLRGWTFEPSQTWPLEFFDIDLSPHRRAVR